MSSIAYWILWESMRASSHLTVFFSVRNRREGHIRVWCHSLLIKRTQCKGGIWLDSWEKLKKNWIPRSVVHSPPGSSCPEQLSLTSPHLFPSVAVVEPEGVRWVILGSRLLPLEGWSCLFDCIHLSFVTPRGCLTSSIHKHSGTSWAAFLTPSFYWLHVTHYRSGVW